jgi:hypothetical protein
MTVEVLPPAYVAKAGLSAHDVTTHGRYFRPLSPMLLGPVMLYDGLWSRTMENAWQYAKLYPGHADNAAADPWPTAGYWTWARAGWDSQRAERYPMGRGARPLYSLWAGEHLGYVAARRRIYIPLYAQAVRFYQARLLGTLRQQAATSVGLVIQDFDAYDRRALGYSWDDVINDPDRKMGHGFVLAMMIEGIL